MPSGGSGSVPPLHLEVYGAPKIQYMRIVFVETDAIVDCDGCESAACSYSYLKILCHQPRGLSSYCLVSRAVARSDGDVVLGENDIA